MGLRNMIMGTYYCAQAHEHSSHSEVDKCNEVFRMKNQQDHERSVRLAEIKAGEQLQEQRTLQMKYYAEAARDVKIAQMNAARNGLTYNQDMPTYANNAPKALPWHDTADSFNPRQRRQITPSLAGSHSYSRPETSFGSYRPRTIMYADDDRYARSNGRNFTHSGYHGGYDRPAFSRTSTWVSSIPEPPRQHRHVTTRRSCRCGCDNGSDSDNSDFQSYSSYGHGSSYGRNFYH